jgi:hypothetical protein
VIGNELLRLPVVLSNGDDADRLLEVGGLWLRIDHGHHIAVLALVGRGVQGKDVVLHGHLVEENGENTLLHLTGVLGTQDNHLLLGEVDSHRRSRGHAFGETVGRERTGVVDDIVGMEVLQLLARRADQHIAHEESMVGARADDTDVDTVSLIPAGITIDDIDAVTGVEVVNSTFTVDTPDLTGVG